MKNMLKTVCIYALIAATGFLAIGCEKENNATLPDPEPEPTIVNDDTNEVVTDITNIKWHLTKFVDLANHTETLPIPSDDTHSYWIKLCNDTIQGRGLANEMLGAYTISENQIQISIFGYTKIGIINPNHEEEFFSAIEKAESFNIERKTLHLYYNDRNNYLKFEKVTE